MAQEVCPSFGACFLPVSSLAFSGASWLPICSNEVCRDETLILKYDEVGAPRQVESGGMSGGKG